MISSTSYRLGMLCCKGAHTQLSIGRGRQLQQVLRQSIHYTTPQLSSDNCDNDDKSTSSSTPPVQTLNKSPIVQQLWKTRDEAKRRVMGDLTLGDGEYSGESLFCFGYCNKYDMHMISKLTHSTPFSYTQMYR